MISPILHRGNQSTDTVRQLRELGWDQNPGEPVLRPVLLTIAPSFLGEAEMRTHAQIPTITSLGFSERVVGSSKA